MYNNHQRKLQRACIKTDTVSIAPTEESTPVLEHCVYLVYTDLPQVLETLKRPEFTFCKYSHV